MSQLDAIAANMRTTLTATGARYVHCKLRRGLEIVLERRERGWRLALGRTDAPPSDTDIELCQAAFHVPPGVDATLTAKQRLARGRDVVE